MVLAGLLRSSKVILGHLKSLKVIEGRLRSIFGLFCSFRAICRLGWMGWLSKVIGILRAPSVLITCMELEEL